MKIEYITIDAGQRFDAVMPEIPTNSIINKTVTGCGRPPVIGLPLLSG